MLGVFVICTNPTQQFDVLAKLAETPGNAVASDLCGISGAAGDEFLHPFRFAQSRFQGNRRKLKVLHQVLKETIAKRERFVRAVGWFAERDDVCGADHIANPSHVIGLGQLSGGFICL